MKLEVFFRLIVIVSGSVLSNCHRNSFQDPYDDDGDGPLQQTAIVESNHVAGEEDKHGTKVTRQIEEMFRVHSYELSIKPSNGGKPMKVEIGILIESITDISEKNMDLTFTLCIHESWVDHRLRFTTDDPSNSIVLPSRLVKKIWVPDTYIVGSKHSFIQQTTVENTVLRLFSDGRIFYNVKMTTTVACQMNLHNFPLDQENCSLIIQSLGYNYQEIQLEWLLHNYDNIFMDKLLVMNMPKFMLVRHSFSNVNVTRKSESMSGDNSISQLQLNFIFRRYLMSVFFQSYFLAMSMVVLAGLGMWIDPSSVPARVAISVTSVLTLSTIITGLKTSLPKVSYLTAMDIYLWICFLFIFSTVVEFCVFNYVTTVRKKKSVCRLNKNLNDKVKKEKRENGNGRKPVRRVFHHGHITRISRQNGGSSGLSSICLEDIETERNIEAQIRALHRRRSRFCKYIDSTDVVFRLAYFVSFLLFNGFYWNYYISVAYE